MKSFQLFEREIINMQLANELITVESTTRGGSRNFGKGGPVRGRSPEPSAEGASAGGESGSLPHKILKN